MNQLVNKSDESLVNQYTNVFDYAFLQYIADFVYTDRCSFC